MVTVKRYLTYIQNSGCVHIYVHTYLSIIRNDKEAREVGCDENNDDGMIVMMSLSSYQEDFSLFLSLISSSSKLN